MIEVCNLTKLTSDKHAILQDVSFKAENTQLVGLIGPNGAGKTTLFRTISGVYRTYEGRIRIDNLPMGRTSVAKNRLAYVTDSIAMYDRLTAFDNIVYFGQLRGLTKSYILNYIRTFADGYGLIDILHKKVKHMSHGERVKVNLCRSLIHMPNNVLLDEPTSGLDVPAKRWVYKLLKSLRENGATIIVSSHLLNELESLCDTLLVIRHGQIVFNGSTQQFCRLTNGNVLENAYVEYMDT